MILERCNTTSLARPLISPDRSFTDAGRLMFYAGALPQMYSDAAVCIEKILRGRLLARADEVIE